jgi:hypothetical protein
MSDATKKQQMRELVRGRREGWIPNGCYRLGDTELNDGFWEEDEFVVPWSKCACNYSAKIMIVAQDWDSFKNLSVPLTAKHERIKLVGRNEGLLTNTRIDKLLHQHFGLTWADTFATDVFPFVKPGGMRGDLMWKDFVRCARDFALPQIVIIRPRMVICLGRSTTFRALAEIIPDSSFVPNGDDPLGPLNHNGTKIYGVTHTGGRGNGWIKRIDHEWAFLSTRLAQLTVGEGVSTAL